MQQVPWTPTRPKDVASCDLWWNHGVIGINTELSCGRTKGTDMVLSSSLSLYVTMTPDDSKSHPDQNIHSGNMVHEPNLNHRKQPSTLEKA